MPKWDHQNTQILFAAVGIGLLFVTLLASRNSFQLTRTSILTNYQEANEIISFKHKFEIYSQYDYPQTKTGRRA